MSSRKYKCKRSDPTTDRRKRKSGKQKKRQLKEKRAAKREKHAGAAAIEPIQLEHHESTEVKLNLFSHFMISSFV